MPLRVVFAIFVIFLAMLAGAMWGGTHLPSYYDCKANGSDQGAASSQGSSKRLAPKPPVSDNSLWDCEGVVAEKNGNAITAIATVLLTVATGLLGFIAYLQFGAARNQARPYVFALAKEIESWSFGNPLRIKVVLENVGTTPAYEVEWGGTASIECIPPYRPKSFLRRARFMAVPKASTPHAVSPLLKEPFWDLFVLEPAEFSPEILEFIGGGFLGICIYSRARHRDIFGGRHLVESCHYIETEDARRMIDDFLAGKIVASPHMQVRHAPHFNRMT